MIQEEKQVLHDGDEPQGLSKVHCQVIYQPKGPAREYAPLAVNLGVGCSHGCKYCYGPRAAHVKTEIFRSGIRVRNKILEKLEKDASLLKGDNREIFLSFLADPYCLEEMKLGLTRQAIKILIANGLHFTVLTKGGIRAGRDFDLLAGYDKTRFGTTLVFNCQTDADYWEPYAASVSYRINTIEVARMRGIKTWVSLEPVIDPRQTLGLVKTLHPIVDHWKVGKLNYMPTPEPVDWRAFRDEITALFNSVGADYYIKKNLRDL